jgi:hypothetical protein
LVGQIDQIQQVGFSQLPPPPTYASGNVLYRGAPVHNYWIGALVTPAKDIVDLKCLQTG